ncbi:dehydrogenase [Halovenus sp. WSH3]|uniref:Dehydrogenase n=1 Tax=Halovenus carboxidivorans TaxID=2692199 RepID=A0A6B0T6R6_9EURY|nr:molecular chaperone TorD family protein [Halovenus carboxidivorans]MXR50972.1 dehydrogenase [Halovenus carboxidivorans]
MGNILGSGTPTQRPGPEASEESELTGVPTYEAAPENAVDRARLYSLCSLALDRPGDQLTAMLSADEFGPELLDAAGGLDDPDLTRAAEQVADVAADSEGDELYGQWGSLFGIEEGVTVSPYELTYLPGPLMTATRELADIAGFYKAFDLTIADGENDRKDHVIFQTEFLSDLALREAELKRRGDDEGIEIVVGARRAFVEEHLGRWYWRFAEEVNKQDGGFYAAVANLLAVVVETEIDRLDVDPDWVPDDPEVIEWNEDLFGDSGRGCGGCGGSGDGEMDQHINGMRGEVPAGPEEFGLGPDEFERSGPE